ncbi:MAG: AI-2E family transporter [Bryobacteraceae bacterium]|jgi:predicted PurR-regulated permease PerM
MTKHQTAPNSSGIRNIAILFAVVAALYLARELLIPLAFAITLSMILAPFVAWLQKMRLGRVPSALLVVVVATASAGGIGWVIFNDLVQVAIDLPGYKENIDLKIQALNAPGKSAFGRAAASVQELSKQIASAPQPVPPADAQSAAKGRRAAPSPISHPLAVQIVDQPGNELEYVANLAKPFLGPLAVFGMVLIFSLYLLIEHNDLRNRLFRLVGLQQLNLMTQALNDATQRVSRYLMLQLLVNACFGALFGTGLYLIGLPYAALWGAVAAILRIVPYIGSLVAAALPLALSLAVFNGWAPPLEVFLLFAIIEVITGNFVEPWLYGVHTGVSSLALLLATVFWAALWGPAGLILSTPLTVCVLVLGRYVPRFSFLHVLLGDEAPLEAEAIIYQRLLDMDEQEARVVADRYLKEHTLTQLYDSVLIPALTMAEHDRHKGALDAVREEFFFLSMKEMLAELPDDALKSAPPNMEAAAETAAPPKPEWPAGRVICIPANDEADEISASMLSQLLELGGCAALSFPVDPDMLHLMQVLDPSADDVICISSLPPFAFSHAKNLSRQLRARFPLTKIIVGVWGFAGDAKVALERFPTPRPEYLATSLEQAVQTVATPVEVPAEV